MRIQPISAAVLIALYGGTSHAAPADEQQDAQNNAVAEIVVTASRRQQTIEETPYSISVVNPADIENAGVTDAGVGSLAHASNAAYTTSAMLNLPIGDTLAFRTFFTQKPPTIDRR